MTNPHEPSYYEIALTNRQVVVAFVILLLCLVSAFFSGLWIGRESAARAQEQIVRNVPPTPAEPQEGQALEEFRFFEDDQQKGTTPAPAPAKEAAAIPSPTPTPEDTTLLEDLGGEGDEEAVADPDLPEGRRRRGRNGRNAAQGDEEEAVASAPVPPRTPSPSPTPARPRTSATAPAEPRVAAGQLVIQVFSSADADQAESVRGRLVKGGHKAYLSPVQVGGRTMYRVRIGPFDSRDQAQKVAEQVRKGYKLDTWVTE
ncbi:MAG: SPOR domain-containing protein [Acidobacteriota bacterium]